MYKYLAMSCHVIFLISHVLFDKNGMKGLRAMTNITGLLLVSLYTFASPSNIFKYFQRRYDDWLIRRLNQALKLKGRHIRAVENIRFLRKCLTWYVTPVWIRRRVRATRPKAPTGIERAFVKDEINKEQDVTTAAFRDYRQL